MIFIGMRYKAVVILELKVISGKQQYPAFHILAPKQLKKNLGSMERMLLSDFLQKHLK